MLSVVAVFSIFGLYYIYNSYSKLPLAQSNIYIDNKPSDSKSNIYSSESFAIKESILQDKRVENGTHKIKTTSETTIASNKVGSVKELSFGDLASGQLFSVDLSAYELDSFAIKWSGGEFEWGLNSSDEIPDLVPAEVSDEIDPNQEELISDLLSFDSKSYLFIKPTEPITNFRIHLINPSEETRGSHVSSAPSNYSSGPKYSTLNIIPREVWSGDPNINDPRVPGLCDILLPGDPDRPIYCDECGGSPCGGRLIWEPYYYSVNKVVVHHTADSNNSHPDPASQVRGIYNYHAYSVPWCARYENSVCVEWRNGWGDIGYNYLIDHYGNIYEGKLGGDEAKGYHASSGNYNSIGISIIGTYSTVTPSPAAQDALVKLIAEKAALHDFTPSWNSTVFGHRYFQNTACPGDAFYAILPSLSASASNYKDSNFSEIKSVVAHANHNIDNLEYSEYQLLLRFNNDVSMSTLSSLFPVYNNEVVSWNGIDHYLLNEDQITLHIDYDFGTQLSRDRLKTLYKIFWLRNDVEAAGLNFKNYVANK